MGEALILESSADTTAFEIYIEQMSIRLFAERDHKNIVSWHFYDRGNHFATQTAPDLLINDVRTFFEKLRER